MEILLTAVTLHLIWLYTNSGRNAGLGIPKLNSAASDSHARLNALERRHVRDVEEFELGGLLEEEDEDANKRDSGSIDNIPPTKRSSIERN